MSAKAANFRSLGEPSSVFVGYAGPSTLGAVKSYFPDAGYGQAGSFVSRAGVEQTLVPVFAGVSPFGWGTQITVYDRSGSRLASVSPELSNSGAWMVALPGINLVDATAVQIVVTAPKTGYEGTEGTPESLLKQAEALVYGTNVTGLFEDISGLFESGLLRDDGDVLGQLLSSTELR
jgi:hypothetical protein